MEKRIKKSTRLLVLVVVLSSFVGCDQATKRYATSTLQDSNPISLFGNTVRFEHALNPGGFLSLGASLSSSVRSYLFISFNIFTLMGIVVFLMFNWNSGRVVFVSLAFILAGGIGNLIDRISNDGLVTDFVTLGIGPIRTGVFNVADVGVMFGAIVLMISLFVYPVSSPGPKTETTENE